MRGIVTAGAALLSLALAALAGPTGERPDVAQLVRIADGTPSPEVRQEVIGELGQRGGLDAIAPLLDLAERNWEARRLSWAAVIDILERHDDPESYSRVGGILPGLTPTGRARLLSSVADADSSHGRRLLVRTLGTDPSLDPVIVSGLERMSGAAADPEAVERLRTLLDSDRPDLRRDAVRALGRLGDVESLRALAGLLREDDPVVTKEAHWALRQMSGLELPPDAARWELWVDEELRFWKERSEECFERLRSSDPAVVIAAIRDLAPRSLHPELVRGELEALLDHSLPQVRNAAKAALSPRPSALGGGGLGAGGGTAVYRGEEVAAARFVPTRPRQSPRPEEGGGGVSLHLVLIVGAVAVLALLLRVSGHLSPDGIRRLFSRS